MIFEVSLAWSTYSPTRNLLFWRTGGAIWRLKCWWFLLFDFVEIVIIRAILAYYICSLIRYGVSECEKEKVKDINFHSFIIKIVLGHLRRVVSRGLNAKGHILIPIISGPAQPKPPREKPKHEFKKKYNNNNTFLHQKFTFFIYGNINCLQSIHLFTKSHIWSTFYFYYLLIY